MTDACEYCVVFPHNSHADLVPLSGECWLKPGGGRWRFSRIFSPRSSKRPNHQVNEFRSSGTKAGWTKASDNNCLHSSSWIEYSSECERILGKMFKYS